VARVISRAALPVGQISGLQQVYVQSESQKFFAFPVGQIIFINSPRPVPREGRLAIVTDAGRDAVDAEVPLTNGAEGGRRSRVVLTPRRWCQVRAKERGRRWQKSPVAGESTK